MKESKDLVSVTCASHNFMTIDHDFTCFFIKSGFQDWPRGRFLVKNTIEHIFKSARAGDSFERKIQHIFPSDLIYSF
jgi:hypothetical protein